MQWNPIAMEEEVLAFWQKEQSYKKAKEHLKDKKPFYFLDGPPYTSGKMHIGLAWNKSMKDAILRYKRMRGFDAWDRAGYDMHGLPTELKVQEKLGLKYKSDIPGYGLGKFIAECKRWSLENMEIMSKDFRRLGVWMDFDDPYMSIANSFIEGEWWLIKRAHENGRLYKGKKTMHWCENCATSLAKHELEYKLVSDNSIYVKFKVLGKENEYIIVWTTTPWTIPFNLGVMVNPEVDYVRAKIGDEVWIVSKGLAATFINGIADRQFEIIEEFKGKSLEGLGYIHSFADAIDYKPLKEASSKVHTIVLSEEFVDTNSGTGLVHMAPGCGPEDFEIGRRNGITPYNTLDENGAFPEPFKGLRAKIDDAKFIEELRNRGALVAEKRVEHDYAHCWRCKAPIIYRTTEQWFFLVENLKEQMRKLNADILWVPDWAGNRWFDSWLDNLRDNGITRQRYWGSPVPIWQCDKCDRFEVIGSADELKRRWGKLPEDFHIPVIDSVVFSCTCGGEMKRIPDVLDVWIDAGTTSWNCINYPAHKELFEKMYPPDFILEGKDQIRGWFNLLFIASMVSMHKPAYKAVYMHGFVNDSQGRKMSKSLGNIISPYEVIDKYGSDSFRLYAIGGAGPGLDLNYNFDDIKVKQRNLSILWNLHNYVLEEGGGAHPHKGQLEDRWIISRMHSTIKLVTEMMEGYRVSEAPAVIEDLFLDLSRTYIQFTREREDRAAVMATISEVLLNAVTLLAPFTPFIAEKIYQDFRAPLHLTQESIHHRSWPKHEEKSINHQLEENFAVAEAIIQSILACREKAGLGIRWPLREAKVESADDNVRNATIELSEVIRRQCNLKELDVFKRYADVKTTCKVDYAKLGPVFKQDSAKVIGKLSMESAETIMTHIENEGKHVVRIDGKEYAILREHVNVETTLPAGIVSAVFKDGAVYLVTSLTPELEAEGFSRELSRRVQEMRKKNGMVKADRIKLHIKASEKLVPLLQEFASQLSERVGASVIAISANDGDYPLSSQEKIRTKEFGIWIERVSDHAS